MLQFIHNMGKNSALCVNFCCVQFAMLYLQNPSFVLKIIMWHWQDYMWHWQIHLSTFTIELFLDMTLAWDPTFIK